MTIYFSRRIEDIEISKKKLQLLANHYKQIANALVSNEVQAVLKKWQGKAYNKRLETALKGIDEHFHVDRQFGCYLEYNFYNQNERSIRVEVIGYNNQKENKYIYLDNYEHSIYNLTKSILLEDRLTIRNDIAKRIVKCAKYYQAQYEKLNNQLLDLDNILEKYKGIINKANEFTDRIQSDIKAEFKMFLINHG